MDFSLTEDQLSIREAARRFLQAEYPMATRGNPVDGSTAQARWQSLAELGLLGLPFDAAHGGGGQGAVELSLIAREMGRCLAGDGYVSSVVMAGQLLGWAGSAAQQAHWLPRIASGAARLALAHAEEGGRYDHTFIETRAAIHGSGYRLDGRKTLVLGAPGADALLVAARTAGEAADRTGITLFLLPAAARGVRLRPFLTLDGRQAAHVELDAVQAQAADIVGAPGQAAALLERALDAAAVWASAEAVGAIDALTELTTEHLKTRKQFGAPLARFQALQHRMADCLIALEQSEALVDAAAMVQDGAPEALRRKLAAAAKTLVGQAGRQVSEAAIQLHGAMGMTDECRVGHFAKRLGALNQLFGDPHHHLDWYANTHITESA